MPSFGACERQWTQEFTCVYVCMNETSRPIQDRFVRVGQIARAGLKGEETRTSWISMG